MKIIFLSFISLLFISCSSFVNSDLDSGGVKRFPMILTSEELEIIKEENKHYLKNKEAYERIVHFHNFLKTIEQRIANLPESEKGKVLSLHFKVLNPGQAKGWVYDGPYLLPNSYFFMKVLSQRYKVQGYTDVRGKRYDRIYIVGDGIRISYTLRWKAGFVSKYLFDVEARYYPLFSKRTGSSKLTLARLFSKENIVRGSAASNTIRGWGRARSDITCSNRGGSWNGHRCVYRKRKKKYNISRNQLMMMMAKTNAKIAMQNRSLKRNNQMLMNRRQRSTHHDSSSSRNTKEEKNTAYSWNREETKSRKTYQNKKMENEVKRPKNQSIKIDTKKNIVTKANSSNKNPWGKLKKIPSMIESRKLKAKQSGATTKAFAACWQTKSKSWICHGPLQRLYVGEGTKKLALQRVSCKTSNLYKTALGKGKAAGKKVYVYDCNKNLKKGDVDVFKDNLF